MTDHDFTREEIAGLLAQADRDAVVALADEIIAALDDPAQCRITRAPQVGAIQVQVREPIAAHRFVIADALATNVEVRLGDQGGWAIRLGDDATAVTAQAICDAEYAASGEYAGQIATLCRSTAQQIAHDRAAHWRDLQPTIVEFEEVH
ncbi:phosphonate metabolism protein PhnG [Epidermidibacterium keratini]|uniref:Phosphonate metabolism protein PhnG n=1 Tax=Epidermidibacterium keratini TaxID=1891644 RepID=A0A7M3T4Z7_9ACTN|nr:phosphonate C-P lyase system protein PhnG [Epidermidibacterium keratini]QHB98843.1 phosphonate metabolism protein PhnG [Epidermidibacterium keratini]